ncbi:MULTISPECIES: acyl carrier protein [Streptomyces]|uniref:acyl carrier protein n=1 Tax=Streptomyces TaxID=1883 RepID=UPI00093BE533|nr:MULTISPECIES: acyl carrier protein [unclassified Streptomyces]OKJ01250.1 acyl carrier protein [Streptomyces sp. TSRI0261]QNQ35673.1 acyl carrier protein [Streptomyces sp. CB00271]
MAEPADFTLDDLRRILRAGAGVDELTDLEGEIADTPLVELGYDSLAVLETVTRIEREYGIRIPEGDLEHGRTPRETVDYVNGRLREVRV